MSKIKNLTRKAKVGALASGAAVAATLAAAPLAGAAPAAPPSGAGELQGTTLDAPVSGEPNAILGHSRPDSVTVGDNSRTFHWHWRIEHGKALYLPAFDAGKDSNGATPYVASDGVHRTDFEFWKNADAWQADLKVQASEGVGYGSFKDPTESDDPNHQGYMTGWPEGNVLRNNVAASLIHDSTFDLWVTTTTGGAVNAPGAARENRFYGSGSYPWVLFPWTNPG